MPGFVPFRDLERKKGLPYSRATVDRLERAGKFPRRAKIGDGMVAWVDEELDAYKASLIAKRDSEIP